MNNKYMTFGIDKFFCWFMVWIWCENTIIPYLLQIYKRLPLVGQTYVYIYDIVSLILLFLSAPYWAKRIKAKDTLFYMVCAIVVLLTILLLPKNAEYIIERWYQILIVAIPMYYIGIAYEHNKLKTLLYYASLISVAVNLLYQIYKISLGHVLLSDNMDASYKLLPSVMYLIYMLFEKVSWLNVTAVIMGLILTFSYGTRGPILAIMIYFLLGLYLKIIHKKSRITSFLYIIVSSLLLSLTFNIEKVEKIAKSLSEGFKQIGFSTRIMDMFLVGDITDDAGRNMLAETVIQAITEKPLLGHGLMGDRVILGRYVHNIILELLCDYGIIIGSAFIIALIGIIIYALYNNRNSSKKYFLLAMLCMIFVKLSFSGSFVYDQYFYLIIGLCVGACRESNQDIVEEKKSKETRVID